MGEVGQTQPIVGGEGVADGGEHHVVLLEEGFHVDVGVRCRQVDDGQVEQAEWDVLCRQVETHFRAGRFREGALAALDGAARLLEQHLPPRKAGRNELPDQPLLL